MNMNKEKSGFFLVREEILPEAIKKTIRVKEMLKRGDARTIGTLASLLSRAVKARYLKSQEQEGKIQL